MCSLPYLGSLGVLHIGGPYGEPLLLCLFEFV